MKTVLRNIKKEKEQLEQQRLIERIQRRTVKIVLKRLTKEEIDFYCGNNKKKIKRNICTKPTLKMKLRKRR